MKKLQKLFAMLLAVCMVMSMLSVSAFAAEKTSAIQIVEDGGRVYYLADPQEGEVAGPTNFDVWTSKTIAGTPNEDEFEVTLQVGTTMKAIPNDVAVVLVMDTSGSMMMDKNGYKWGRNGELPTDGRMLRIDYAREAALEFAEQLAENSGGAQRMLSVVEFGNNAYTVLPWTDANDNGTLNEDVRDAISSVDVNFKYDTRSFWYPELVSNYSLQKDNYAPLIPLKAENWSGELYTHEAKSFFEAKFADEHQSFMTEYVTYLVTEMVGEEEVTRCAYPECAVSEPHTHCTVEDCDDAATHSHCTFAGCAETADHTHCTRGGCTETAAGHKHCSVCGVSDAEKPEDAHCTFDGCGETAEHTHCTYSICANPAGHQHCERRCWCEEDHAHCWDIQNVCGRTDEHTHVIGCTVDFCQDTTPNHMHGCIHGTMGMYPFYDNDYVGGYMLSTARCLNTDPNHMHDVYDGDTDVTHFNRVHQQCVACCTNMEGGLMLARNLVIANGGAIAGINDVYVILLSDGWPTYHVDQNQLSNADTEVKFIPGAKGGRNITNWADVVDIVETEVADGETDVALVKDIKDIAEFFAILYGTEMGDKLGGSHALSNVTSKEWFTGTGVNYVGADAVFESSDADKLNTVFAQIKNRIDVLAKAWTVTDALSDDVTFGEFLLNGEFAGYAPAAEDKEASVSWSLGNMEPDNPNAAGGVNDPFVYTLKYKVKLNSAQDDVKATSLKYDANKADENSNVSLPGVWTGKNTNLKYFMVEKTELDKMTAEEIAEQTKDAPFKDVSVKGIYGDYEFIKKDKETDGVIEGVGFTLYDASGKAYGAEIFSDSEGKVTFTDIPRGDYTLKETTVPDGMQQMSDLDSRISWGEITAVNGGEMPDVIYNWPVGAEIPDGGGTGNPGGNDGGGGGTIIIPSNPTTPDVNIDEEDVPLGELPEEEAEIPEEDVPLADLPEEEVPLAMAPATGDAAVIWTALSALSGAGLFLNRKKREDEE